MVYKLGKKIRSKYQTMKILILTLTLVTSTGIVLSNYIASKEVGFVTNTAFSSPQLYIKDQSPSTLKSTNSSGSAHVAPASQENIRSANLPISPILQTTSCNLFPPANPGLSNAQSPQLRKLAQYEGLCNGSVAARDSFFVTTPTTVTDAQSEAADVAATLKEYAEFNIKPLVFIEPDTIDGNNINLGLYAAGNYDSSLDAYFSDLKVDGITDTMMGMWVVLPEGNIPVWTSVDPTIYETVVTKTIEFQKKYFPNSQSAILLDSETYPSGASWGNGNYVSLLPFVKDIPKGLVDSFGLQGFPWAPPANQGGDKVYDPKTYLRIDFAAEAARSLGINNIWFNTGTFNQMYTQDSSQTVTALPVERQTMLQGVIAQAKILQGQGFSVSIHLFAEDKSSTSEAVDWSYWKTSPGTDANTVVFTTFAHDAAEAAIPLWLFDTYDH